MDHRLLGSSQVSASVVGLGCNNFGGRLDIDQTREVVNAAIDAGVTFFDTADIYGNQGGSETQLGEVLKGRRGEVVLATKFGHASYAMPGMDEAGPKGGRAYIRKAIEGSLQRLQTDYVDLYQLHTPDDLTPIEETLQALNELVEEGKVLAIGASNFSADQMRDAATLASDQNLAEFVTVQNEWSLLERGIEPEVLPTAGGLGVSVLPYFPLANGMLTGKVRKDSGIPQGSRLATREGYVTEDRLDRVEDIAKVADEHGRTLLELAFGYLLGHPATGSVIAGATKPEQVRANALAASRPLSDDEMSALSRLM